MWVIVAVDVARAAVCGTNGGHLRCGHDDIEVVGFGPNSTGHS